MKTDWNEIPQAKGEPDFDNLLAVLRRGVPSRPTLFEFFLNDPLYRRLVPEAPAFISSAEEWYQVTITANRRIGYDFATLLIPGVSFVEGKPERRKERTVSLNERSLIHNRSEFDAYPWPDIQKGDFDILARLGKFLPKGMKLIPYTPDGLLENATDLVGYQNLCMLIKDEPQLAHDIFDQVGMRLAKYYECAARYDTVGACIVNDDWGFKTQTQFSPDDMRRFVFPWTQRFVEIIHAAGKPAILHSCGYFERIIEDVIEEMKFDGRHSYEDNILPVEQAYERYSGRIAIMGGIDVDFICRSKPEEVYARSKAMLERAAGRGSYAHGSGNSIPDYVPHAGYFAMIRAAMDMRE